MSKYALLMHVQTHYCSTVTTFKPENFFTVTRRGGIVEIIPIIQENNPPSALPNEYQVSKDKAHVILFVKNTLVLSNYTCVAVSTTELKNDNAATCVTSLQVP